MKPDNLRKILSLPSPQAAPLLLGWHIIRKLPKGLIKLKIVETEAYRQDDPASHSYRGLTARTAPMFDTGGTIYVYFTYGVHYCLNFVTGSKEAGEAVLIRAGEPLMGIEIMKSNRGVKDVLQLANGPGKLTQALGIKNAELSGKLLNKSSIFLKPPKTMVSEANIAVSRRIGISRGVDTPWRFYIKDSPFVSKAGRSKIEA